MWFIIYSYNRHQKQTYFDSPREIYAYLNLLDIRKACRKQMFYDCLKEIYLNQGWDSHLRIITYKKKHRKFLFLMRNFFNGKLSFEIMLNSILISCANKINIILCSFILHIFDFSRKCFQIMIIAFIWINDGLENVQSLSTKV